MLLPLALLVPIASLSVSSVAQGQTTSAQYKAALDAAQAKMAISQVSYKLVSAVSNAHRDTLKAEEKKVKALWAAVFAGNAANRQKRKDFTIAIVVERAPVWINLISGFGEDKDATLAYAAAALEVAEVTPDWGRGLANANLANLKASAATDYYVYANDGFVQVGYKIGAYLAWLSTVLVL